MTDDETDDGGGFERDEENGVAADDGDDAPLGGLADEVRRRRSASGRESAGGDDPDDPAGTPPGSGPADDDGPEADGVDSDETTDRGTDPDGPLGGLADEVRGRRADRDAAEADAAEAEAAGEAFTEMEHREINAERLWEALDDDETDRVAVGELADDATDGVERVVPKRTCETCPHFADPPEVACTHEGTEILELVGMDEHRVLNCPMVADEDALDE